MASRDIVDKANRAVRSDDSVKKALIAGMLKMAEEAITGASAQAVSNNLTVNGGNNNLTDFMNTKT